MKLNPLVCVAMLSLTAAGTAGAQSPGAPEQPTGLTARALAVAPSTGPARGFDKTLPELKFDGVSLDEATKLLHDATGANFAVVRDPAAPPNYPVLSNFEVQNVSVQQALLFIQRAYPGVSFEIIDGPAAPLIVVRVAPPPPADAASGGVQPGQIMIGGGGAFPGVILGGPADVSIIRLTEIIDSMVDRRQADNSDTPVAEVKKKVIADLLALVQASLDQVKDKQPATLKLHEATQTLLFQGTPKQQMIISQALASLQTPPPSGWQSQDAKVASLGQQLQNSERARAAENREFQIRSAHDEAQLDAVRSQIKMADAREQELTAQVRELRLDNAERAALLQRAGAATAPAPAPKH